MGTHETELMARTLEMIEPILGAQPVTRQVEKFSDATMRECAEAERDAAKRALVKLRAQVLRWHAAGALNANPWASSAFIEAGEVTK